MKTLQSSLYQHFEKHLSNLSGEIPDEPEFIALVVVDYLDEIRENGLTTDPRYLTALIEELQEEVSDMLKKKTYGHYDLREYHQKVNPATNKKP